MLFAALSQPRVLPKKEQALEEDYSSAAAVPRADSTCLAEDPAQRQQQQQQQQRFFEVTVRNLSGRSLRLQGSTLPSVRKTAAGPQAATAAPRCVAPALVPDPDAHPPPTAQARFTSDAKLGDLLEFTLSYLDDRGEGLTVRAHAHATSSMRSSCQVHGQDLEVSSVIEEVPRMVARPPLGYAETALGVYAKPGRCAALQLGELRPGDEVLRGAGPRDGRWMKITWPMQGWIQAETRDGRPLFEELLCLRPNLRMVITLRPMHGRPGQPLSARLPGLEAAVASPPHTPAEELSEAAQKKRETEGAYFSARAAEASRLIREKAWLEMTMLKTCRPRQSVLGVF
eukprot:TRINITY_DN7245_c0_g1_i2.p1 TRINITY_DN7245_c0_g1~~TRINITY_DN7245_c0_g1_i2.p1  ORF type:complete len:342 (+),score=70.75 TRINITY_DN7245_c0_g1_i2:48-1073(+)